MAFRSALFFALAVVAAFASPEPPSKKGYSKDLKALMKAALNDMEEEKAEAVKVSFAGISTEDPKLKCAFILTGPNHLVHDAVPFVKDGSAKKEIDFKLESFEGDAGYDVGRGHGRADAFMKMKNDAQDPINSGFSFAKVEYNAGYSRYSAVCDFNATPEIIRENRKVTFIYPRLAYDGDIVDSPKPKGLENLRGVEGVKHKADPTYISVTTKPESAKYGAVTVEELADWHKSVEQHMERVVDTVKMPEAERVGRQYRASARQGLYGDMVKDLLADIL